METTSVLWLVLAMYNLIMIQILLIIDVNLKRILTQVGDQNAITTITVYPVSRK